MLCYNIDFLASFVKYLRYDRMLKAERWLNV